MGPHLKSNLCEIYSSMEGINQLDSLDLVSNYCETRVYNAKKGWGRIWVWVFSIFHFLGLKNIKEKKLVKTIETVVNVFKGSLLFIQAELIRYQEDLKKSLEEQPLNSQNFKKAKKNIRDWNEATTQFISFIKKKQTRSIGDLTDKFFDIESPSNDLFKELKHQQNILIVEGKTGVSIPFGSFNRLVQGKSLSVNQKRALEVWIEKVNALLDNQRITIQVLHMALGEIAKLIKTTAQSDANVNLCLLESKLLEHRCHLFKVDPRQRKKYFRHKPESIKENKRLIIGDCLSPSLREDDDHIVFKLNNEEDKVIVFGKNCIILGFEFVTKENEWRGTLESAVHLQKVFHLDKKGRFAILEKGTSLNTLQWPQNLENEEVILRTSLLGLSSLIYHMSESGKENEWLCEPLFPKYFIIDANGTLKVTRKLSKAEFFDLKSFENFCSQCSKNRLDVFEYLMKVSQLSKHPLTVFYQEEIHKALMTGWNEKNISFIEDFDIKTQKKWLKDIYGKLIELRLCCCEEIQKKIQIKTDYITLEKEVTGQIFKYYKKTCSVTMLRPEIKDQVIDYFCSKTEDPNEQWKERFYQLEFARLKKCQELVQS